MSDYTEILGTTDSAFLNWYLENNPDWRTWRICRQVLDDVLLVEVDGVRVIERKGLPYYLELPSNYEEGPLAGVLP